MFGDAFCVWKKSEAGTPRYQYELCTLKFLYKLLGKSVQCNCNIDRLCFWMERKYDQTKCNFPTFASTSQLHFLDVLF